jgi:branched-chain amino acid transport system ATP-binding protein
MTTLLEIEELWAGYGEGDVLQGASLSVDEGSVVTLLGRNGVGKTSTLRSVVGLITPSDGTIQFDGEDITGCQPHEAYRRGISLVPEDRGIFPELTVEENLQVPLVGDGSRDLAELYELFPKLDELRNSKGKHLSGGEQQMLTFARALRPDPDLFMLDEPSEGLAPQIVEDVARAVESIEAEGTTILLVEQNIRFALDVAEYAYVMDDGQIVLEDAVQALRGQEEVLERHLGIHET